MPNKHGDWIWYELSTTDSDAATAFYEAVIPSWSVAPPMSDDFDYRGITAIQGMIGGVMAITQDMKDHGARPIWVGYITVDDVDKMVGSIEEGGGTVYMPARDMEGVGRFAMVSDPQGVPFYVMKPAPPADQSDATSHAFAYDHPIDGHCAWNELITADPAGALHFYGVRFGWVKDGEMDMGPMGKYEFIRHGNMIGAVMPKPAELPVSMWNHYFRVPSIDTAAATITEQGGKVLQGPQEVPGGDWVILGLDPQGAAFALVGKKDG